MTAPTTTRARRWQLAAALVASGAWACMTVTDVELLEISGTGFIAGQAFLDMNGNGVANPGDSALRAASIELVAQGTQAVVAQDTTDSLGIFVLPNVPVGAYQIRIAAAVLGDSLNALGTGGNVTVALGDTTVLSLGASFPVLTLEQALTAPLGRRVFTAGTVLNPRQFNGDGLVFFKGATGYLRGTNVDRVNVAPGDSVRLLGRRVTSQGRPALDAVTPIVLIPLAQNPVPVEQSVTQARQAGGGALDAALVRIRDAEIQDTSTVANDFYFWAHAGGDSIEVVLRSFLNFNPNPAVRPDTIVALNQAVGLLAPIDDGSGSVRWRLLVRSAGELVTFNKSADLEVTAAFDTAAASIGDTVEIRVTVRNVTGPQTATGVQVSDTVSNRLTFLSSTATRGSYSSATRLWTVGNLAPGVADTLRILATVTGPAGVISNTARLQPLQREVEINAGNNVGTTPFPGLTIS